MEHHTLVAGEQNIRELTSIKGNTMRGAQEVGVEQDLAILQELLIPGV